MKTIIEYTFEELATQHIEFGKKIYPNSTVESCFIHAKKEMDEVLKELYDDQPDYVSLLEEFADVFLCIISAVGKAGFTPSQLVEAIAAKIEVNQKREWKQNPDGTYSHVK